MMKRWMTLMLALLFCACAFFAAAEDGWEDEYPDTAEDFFAYMLNLLDEQAAPGATMEGTTLILPEGLTEMGYPMETIWADEDFDWDSLVILEGEFWSWYDEENDEYISFVDSIRLPSTLRRIGEAAFIGVNIPGDLVIPEGVEELDNCFDYCSIGRLILPSTLRSLSGNFFSSDSRIGEIVLAEDNPYLCLRDGEIYTRDMRTLLAVQPTPGRVHFDVAAGVEEIGPYAFANNEELQTVSLPIGLKRIGRCAFLRCGRLTAINVPLTVESIGAYAFSNCVSLERVTLPPALAWTLTASWNDEEYDEEEAEALRWANDSAWESFFNCPALKGTFAGDNGVTTAERFDPADYYLPGEMDGRYVIANPAGATGTIPVYNGKGEGAAVVDNLPCGAQLNLNWKQLTWADLAAGSSDFWRLEGSAGFVRKADVVLPEQEENLFSLFQAHLAEGAEVWVCSKPRTDVGSRKLNRAELAESRVYYWSYERTPWMMVGTDAGLEYVFIGCVEMTRENTGDDRTLGFIVSDKPQNRVHLRQKPSKSSVSLGKFFSGTQVEILDKKGDFWQVRIGDKVGWMMKKYVRIVPQEEGN